MGRQIVKSIILLSIVSVFGVVSNADQSQKEMISLGKAIEIAYWDNPNLKAARSQLKAAENQIKIARSNFLPRLDVEQTYVKTDQQVMAFGITFQVPVAVVLLVRMNVVSIEKLREGRPYVLVGAFVVGAIFTPPDVVSQFLLAVPLWMLYEAGIVVASWVSQNRKPEITETP